MYSYVFTLLIAVLAPITAFALPNPVATGSTCSKDAVYLQLAVPLLASTASKFCTTYIRSTVSATTTITKPATATVTQTVTTDIIVQKRAITINLANLAPSAILSSACSCLLTASPPPPTTVYPFTTTATTTVTTLTQTQTVTETCPSAAFTSPISNGNFSQGFTSWTIVSTVNPGCGENESGYCTDGDPSDPGATFYGPQTSTLSQSLVTCPGTIYLLTVTYKSLFCAGVDYAPYTFSVDGQVLIDGTNQACGEGVYPNLDNGPYHTQSATFTANSSSPVFAVFMSFAYSSQDYWIESVVVAPAQ